MTLPEDGGYELRVEGTFELGHRYEIEFLGTGISPNPKCYSGKPGQGNTVYPWTALILRAYTPVLPAGGPYTVKVTDLDTAETHSNATAPSYVYRDFKSTVFAMRKVLPPLWRTGPRDIDLVPPT